MVQTRFTREFFGLLGIGLVGPRVWLFVPDNCWISVGNLLGGALYGSRMIIPISIKLGLGMTHDHCHKTVLVKWETRVY